MSRRQTSSQYQTLQLQPCDRRLFPWKQQKSHLEILGSLIFCVGLTLTKPAWSAPPAGQPVLPVPSTDQTRSEGVGEGERGGKFSASPLGMEIQAPAFMDEGSPAPLRDADALQSRPNVLPPEAIAQPTEWSQPVGDDEAKTQEPGSAGNALANLTVPPHLGILEIGDRNRATALAKQNEEQVPPHPPLNTSESLLSDTANPASKNIERKAEGRGQRAEGFVEETENPVQRREITPPLSPFPTPQPQPSPSNNRSESEQSESDEDPELGKLRLRELTPPSSPASSKSAVYLLGGVGYFRSNNIFSGIDPVNDGLFRSGLTILAAPTLGPNTTLFASVSGNIVRYSEQSQYDYNELNYSAGIRQQINSQTYGELGWNNRHLFSQSRGDRFLYEHSIYLELGRRDLLAKQVTLDTYYQLRGSFASPSDRSQLINSVGASLGYNPTSSLQLALDYQFAFAHFTQQERQDQYHQLLARLTYTLSPNSRFYIFGGHSFGHSSDPYIDFNGLVFGTGLNFNLTLF
jgi:hypothetical protein